MKNRIIIALVFILPLLAYGILTQVNPQKAEELAKSYQAVAQKTQMAKINKALDSDITTIYIPPNNENDFISSSMIRELLLNKVDISQFVPSAVNEYFETNCLD